MNITYLQLLFLSNKIAVMTNLFSESVFGGGSDDSIVAIIHLEIELTHMKFALPVTGTK